MCTDEVVHDQDSDFVECASVIESIFATFSVPTFVLYFISEAIKRDFAGDSGEAIVCLQFTLGLI